MPRPSMPPRRLMTTRTLPPVVAPNEACRSASPNIVVLTAAALVAAMPFMKRRRLSCEAFAYSRQQSNDGLLDEFMCVALQRRMCSGESSSVPTRRTNALRLTRWVGVINVVGPKPVAVTAAPRMRAVDVRPSRTRHKWSTYWSRRMLGCGSQEAAVRYVTSWIGHQPAANRQCMRKLSSIRPAVHQLSSPRGDPLGRGQL